MHWIVASIKLDQSSKVPVVLKEVPVLQPVTKVAEVGFVAWKRWWQMFEFFIRSVTEW